MPVAIPQNLGEPSQISPPLAKLRQSLPRSAAACRPRHPRLNPSCQSLLETAIASFASGKTGAGALHLGHGSQQPPSDGAHVARMRPSPPAEIGPCVRFSRPVTGVCNTWSSLCACGDVLISRCDAGAVVQKLMSSPASPMSGRREFEDASSGIFDKEFSKWMLVIPLFSFLFNHSRLIKTKCRYFASFHAEYPRHVQLMIVNAMPGVLRPLCIIKQRQILCPSHQPWLTELLSNISNRGISYLQEWLRSRHVFYPTFTGHGSYATIGPANAAILHAIQEIKRDGDDSITNAILVFTKPDQSGADYVHVDV